MKISVFIPTYNREKYISFALNSIINQTHTDLDIIIYDDGSKDNTISIIEKYQERDHRIRLIKGKVNKGVAYARNELLKACNTKYAIWQDSDDICELSRVEFQFEAMNNCLVFANWCWLKFHLGQWKKRQSDNNLAFASLMFPVDKEITFDEKKQWGGEDWQWIEKMQKKYKSKTLDRTLYYVRFHEDRIGSWKRKIRKDLGGKFKAEELDELSYEDAINKYKESQ